MAVVVRPQSLLDVRGNAGVVAVGIDDTLKDVDELSLLQASRRCKMRGISDGAKLRVSGCRHALQTRLAVAFQGIAVASR